jgi:RHS repeat-associated protein
LPCGGESQPYCKEVLLTFFVEHRAFIVAFAKLSVEEFQGFRPISPAFVVVSILANHFTLALFPKLNATPPSQPLATYRYNALGQRIEKRLVTGEVTQFLYIGSQLTKEKHFNDSGEWQWTRLYVHIGIQPVAFVHLVPEQPAEVYYIMTDHSNRPFIVANAAGAAIWASQADPFGVGAPNEDYDQDGINLTLNLRFPGQYFDAESGLHYNLNRYYDPTTGRYLESDPIGLKGGLNTYAYVGGNPVNFVDPEGLFQFGTRPLEGAPGGVQFPVGNTNLGVRHEHGFYSNGDNVGFFKQGIGPDKQSNLSKYTMFGPHYDDSIMKRAEQELRLSRGWLPADPRDSNPLQDRIPEDYDVLRNNCQDFTDALRNKYRELGGNTCDTPFINGVCQ